MKIKEIISEQIDQAEASQVYQSLMATNTSMGRLTAYYFQQTRNSAKHNNIDSAQQEAEIMAKTALDNIKQDKLAGNDPLEKDKIKKYKKYSDKFRGNQYVKVARDKLPNELQGYLPIIDQGLSKGFRSGVDVGKNLSNLFNPDTIKYNRKR
tara:strand:- start:147 stop:602 length:456 start_codon:yes stop_codon:yes gene_type:complete